MYRDRWRRWFRGGSATVPARRLYRPQVGQLEERLTPSASFVSDPAQFQVVPEVPVLTRLARFVPSAVPQLSSWAGVSAHDTNLDPATNGGDKDIYVIAHGWAPGFETMVEDYQLVHPGVPLKWWQTLDTSLAGSPGNPASPEAFYGSAGDDIQISPTGLAYAITQADPKAVVLLYSWIDESATDVFADAVPEDAFLSEAYTALNGQRLANALELALPSSFHADGANLHLIGHSHGSKVATVATVALDQTANANFHVDQLTILDSPEVSSTLVSVSDAANNLWYFLGALDINHSSSPTPSQTFVDNYISEFDGPIGPIQGVNPLNTSQTTGALQQVVDVNLDGGVLYSSLDFGALHGYAFNWYGGASLPWAQNPSPSVADQWSPLINPANLPSAGSYTQNWTAANQPQFALTAGPINNTVSDTPTFTNLSYLNTTTSGSTYNPTTGQIVLSENGDSTAQFIGEFSPEWGLDGISFNYQFTNVGQGDQLVISVDTGLGFTYQIHYVMTGTVAGTTQGVGTLSLSSLAYSLSNHDIEIELIPLAGSSGASVTISNLQQFVTVPPFFSAPAPTAHGTSNNNTSLPTQSTSTLPIQDVTLPGRYTALVGVPTGKRVLAVFTDPDPSAAARDFSVRVDWGGRIHGKPTLALVELGRSAAGSIWEVEGSALYLRRGTAAVQVTVSDRASGSAFTTRAGPKVFVVVAAPLTDLTPVRQHHVTARHKTGSVAVADFRDANPFALSPDYRVTINWGDGTSSGGKLRLVSRTPLGTTWQVLGEHAYAAARAPGKAYAVTVTITDTAGQSLRTRKTRFLVTTATSPA
jgi:hypothetical protein